MDMKNKKINEQELLELLKRLVDWEALELDFSDLEKYSIVRIPYMMNDAVEYYLLLENCTVTGAWTEALQGKENSQSGEDPAKIKSVSVVKGEKKQGLVIRQTSGNTVTIWYENVWEKLQCYQYHLIGHAWRTKTGEEDLRRLVNLLCVLHDKLHYLGAGACNEEEKWLYALAEFSPLLYYSPIDDSILSWYPQTQKGTEAFQKLVEEAGMMHRFPMLEKYETERRRGKLTSKKIQKYARELLKPENACMITTLQKLLDRASLQWPERDYGEKQNQRIRELRRKTEAYYQGMGYKGEYPEFQKQEAGAQVWIRFAEEHPFTVLESEEYQFKTFQLSMTASDRGTLKMSEWFSELSSLNK